MLAFDVETDNRLDPREGNLVVVAVSDGRESCVYDLRPCSPAFLIAYYSSGASPEVLATYYAGWWQSIHDWLTKHLFDRQLIAHNLAFDLEWLKWHFALETPDWERLHDTMLAEQLIQAGLDMRADLASVAERRLSLELDKTLQRSFRMDGPLSPEQLDYAVYDVAPLYAIKKQQMSEIVGTDLELAWDIERAALPVFVDMRLRGVWVDAERLVPLIDEAKAQVAILAEELAVILTEPVWAWRAEKREAQQREFSAWLERYHAQEELFRCEWVEKITPFAEACLGEGVKPTPKFRERYDELAREHGLEDWIAPKWHDLGIDRASGINRGQKRYAKAKMREWRNETVTDSQGNVSKPNDKPVVAPFDNSPINLKSTQQVHAALVRLGVDVRDFDGKPTLNHKAIKAILPDVAPELRDGVLEPLLRFKKVVKLVDAFGDRLMAMRDSEGALHTGYRQYGTATGRPSASAPNLLQMPKVDSFRRCFRARPGNLLVFGDFSQIEMRIMAELSGDPILIDAFVTGKDTHKMVAAQVFGVDIDAVTDEQRSSGKTLNFGILYGLAAKGYQAQMAMNRQHVTEEQAKAAVEGWRELFSVSARTLKGWGEDALLRGFTLTALGRRRNFWVRRGLERWEKSRMRRQGANFVIQGTSADITKIAMRTVQDRMQALGGTVILQVYDEIVAEVPAEHAVEAAAQLRAGMLAAAQFVLRRVPVDVDVTISPSWSKSEGKDTDLATIDQIIVGTHYDSENWEEDAA